MGGGSGFGIDPYLISTIQRQGNESQNNDMRTLGDLLTGAQQRQAAGYQLQRQRNLADIVRQNAGQFQNPYAQSLAQGGYGQEAFDAQQKAIELGQQMFAIHRSLTASRLSAADTPAKVRAIVKGLPEDVQSTYSPPDPSAPDGDLMDWKKGFLTGQITPEQQAQNNKDRYSVVDEDGRPVGTLDKSSGAFTPLGAGSSAGGEQAAPLGGKRFTQKADVLKALGEDLDPTSGKSDLATSANAQIAAGQRFDAAVKSPGPMTAQKMYELALLSATIANSGHVPDEASIKKMLPETLRGKAAEFWQSTANVPTDVGADAFVQRMQQQSEREVGTAKKQIQGYLLSRLANHPQAFQSFPAEANQMAAAAGLKGLYDPKTGRAIKGAHPQDAAAVAWAKKNPKNALAAQILSANGMK